MRRRHERAALCRHGDCDQGGNDPERLRRRILPPERLADTDWTIVEIDGQAVQGPNYFLQFTADRLSGLAGCNRFSGGYSQSGETLTIGPVAATRMFCPDPGMDHERRALQLLSGPVRISFPGGENMILTGNGVTMRLHRSI